jgi:hypothetical protein
MADNQQAEIPQERRELALQNMDQARTAYSQLMDAARIAREMMKTMVPSNPMAGIKRGSGAGNEVRPAEPRCKFRNGQ